VQANQSSDENCDRPRNYSNRMRPARIRTKQAVFPPSFSEERSCGTVWISGRSDTNPISPHPNDKSKKSEEKLGALTTDELERLVLFLTRWQAAQYGRQ